MTADTPVASRRHGSVGAAGRWLALVGGVALAYYLGARLGLALALVRGQVTPLWPPTGIALAALLVFGRSIWPGILIGSVAVNATLGPSALAVGGVALGATAAPVIVATLLSKAGFRHDLGRLRDVLALVLVGALGGMLVSATIGSAVLVAAGAVPTAGFWLTWSVWWAGDAMGVLVVTPMLLAFLAVRRQNRRKIRVAERMEAAGLIGLTAVLSAAVAYGQLPLLFALFPTLIWSAWRFGLVIVAPCALIVSVGTTTAAATGQAPFAGSTVLHQMLVLQIINGSMALTALLLAVAAAERRDALMVNERSSIHLEERVWERTAALASTIARLEHSESMLTEAQQIGQVGSWERDLVTGAITWSDELFRLYGLPPQSSTMDYATFLEHVHPDDRAVVAESNERAVRDHQPIEMDHRVVWPDRSVHWLHRRGRIVLDEHGDAAKMVGTAQDVTVGKNAEDTLRTTDERTRTLLDAVTDAVVGIDPSGLIRLVNDQTRELFGYAEHELAGKPVEMLLPERFRDPHARYRTDYLNAPQARPMGVGLELFGLRKDGSEFPADIALRPLTIAGVGDGQTLIVAAIRDVTERRRAEEATRQLQETRHRRQQALEINDNVVQGLAASIYALDCDDPTRAIRTLRRTLGTARQMMRNLLNDNTEIVPGDLVREAPATLPSAGETSLAEHRSTPPGPAHRVTLAIADDSPDVRLALRALLETLSGIDIVGEAADGAEAVRIATDRAPDAMLLDLAMPVMDGLEALPLIRAASPDTKVIVLSGYGKDHTAKQALQRGATAFVEKGGSSRALVALLNDLFADAALTHSRPRDPTEGNIRRTTTGPDPDLDRSVEVISSCAHELRNPITALASITELLIDQNDRLPSATTQELLNSMARSLQQMDRLVQTLTDAGRLGTGELELLLEPADIGDLIQTVLTEIRELTKHHPITLNLPGAVAAGIDPLRIRQVLSNLLSNAAKFSQAGSPIIITVTTAGTGIEIAITDHGSGIPAHLRDRLFGKFERLGSQHSGVGLGLYISREIAQAHGGDIVVANTGPDGSTFVLSLPNLLTVE